LDAVLAGTFAGDDAAAHHIALETLRTTLLEMNGASHGTARETELWRARVGLLAERLSDPHDRARAAEVLADVAARHGARLAALGDVVVPYAHDPDSRVRAAVLRFVGHAHLEQHLGLLIERLTADDHREAAAAAEALHAFGPGAMNALLDALEHGKRAVRDATLPILRDMPVSAATLHALIEREVGQMQHVLLKMHGLRKGPARDAVLQRLRERIAEGLHTTLLLLATVLHEDRIAALGRILVQSRDGRRRAVLLEALEALLPPAESAWLIPLLERADPSTLAPAAARALGRPLPSFDEAVRDTLADHDQLTRTLLTATLDAPTRARLAAAQPSLRSALAARPELEHHRTGGHAGHDESMSKVEIILQLRTLDLFDRVTTRDLSELAALVREETHAPGSTIVREGDFGDCLYVVLEGEVYVTREGESIARLKPGEFFGEMSVFDGETRSATITAATRSRLLRLERRDFLQLMDEQPGIAIAICQTLSARVRELIKKVEGRGPRDEDDPESEPRH
jgi:hypothetical protein